MKAQKYRGYRIRKIYKGGYAIEGPSGAHWKTVSSYVEAIHMIDTDQFLAGFLSDVVNNGRIRIRPL